MLFYLFRYLEQFGLPGTGMWSYISFRSLLALILALVISAWFGEYFIKWMKRRNISETQRDAKIDPFGVQKINVPSMGGIIIIVAILVPCLLLGRLRNIYMILMIVTTVWLGILGFLDDYIKIFKKNKDGLAGKYKIVGQVLLGLFVGLTLYLSPDATIRENIEMQRRGNVTEIVHKSEPVKSTITTIPFVKNNNFDYADLVGFCGKYKTEAGWVVFVLVTIFVITAVSNGANLNDGMDGMCAGNSAIIGVALGILAYVSSHIEFAAYLNIMYIPGSEELVVFFCAFIGALIGFLWYNAYPAQVFMGDTGSLTIGGIIAVGAIIIHKELMLPILCGIFFVESLSVMMQVYYYKIGKRRGVKQRIFKRTPIHDNFTAVSNGANLNDGMDGMCAGNSAIIGVALGILAYVSSHIEFAAYLNIMYIPGSEELVVFFCAFIGALIGFLWYNAYPAQVFMGDTGSLTIGGIIAVGAIIIHKELMLPILCGIFFVESLSVMMQVYYYKIGKRRGVKQRIFKRTPIHDNFRTQDSQLDPDCKYLWKKPRNCFHESKITIRFWIVTIILAALTIITLKIR